MAKEKWVLSGIFVLMLLLAPLTPSLADNAHIRDLLVTNNASQLLVYARVTDCFTKGMEEAILAGVPTTFTFLLDLYQERPRWIDKKMLRRTVRHTIKYDNVKKIFYVSTDGEKEPASFQDFESAKRAMADLNGVTVAPLESIQKGGAYYVELKAKLDMVRLPLRMEVVFFFVSLWDFETDWYREGFIY
jgi:hypothetical protein